MTGEEIISNLLYMKRSVKEDTIEDRTITGALETISQTLLSIPIPKNATNGDVIKAMFPNISIYEHGSTYSVNNEYNFNSTWWNKPYKAESEE